MQQQENRLVGALEPCHLPEDVEDKLDLAGCSTELLLLHASMESDRLAVVSDNGQRLSPWVRRLAVFAVAKVVQRLQLTDSATFQGVALLDAWLAARAPETSDSSFIREMPAACVAAVRVLHKTGATKEADVAMWHDAAAAIRAEMPGLRIDWFDLQPHDVRAQEFGLLRSLRWQVNVPSVESWLSMFEGRFGVLMAGEFSRSVIWMREDLRQLAFTMMLWRPASNVHAPRRLAGGLFSIGLLRATLLPAEALRPQHVCHDEWEELFLQSQMMNEVPACALQPEYVQLVLGCLVATTNLPIEEIQRDCEFTMGCLRGARGDLNRMYACGAH
mmetsp:Transcript_34564/g.87800  ORF Transcript_34564/g.87800 Transcript_34564/m.87800 type:complete len:331 (-) Transcript_34564:356-1348(-)